jgi:Protein of unknown function (DUF3710)
MLARVSGRLRVTRPGSEMEGETVIFSRGGGSRGRHAAQEPRRSGGRSRSSEEPTAGNRDDKPPRHAIDEPGGDAPTGEESTYGPYDISDAPDGDFLDLGSLKIPTVEGVEVRVQANNEGVVQQVVLSSADSVLQLAVFAAPRGESIWDDVRANIRKSLASDGVEVAEESGEYGRELRARVQADLGVTDLRFLGIDGPRWMVRAIYQGQAAVEPASAGPLSECLRGLVVDRGKEAMPAEEALPLRLPREMADAARAALAAQSGDQPEVGQPDEAEPSDLNHHTPDHTGGLPTADHMQKRRPSPRPRRPE